MASGRMLTTVYFGAEKLKWTGLASLQRGAQDVPSRDQEPDG